MSIKPTNLLSDFMFWYMKMDHFRRVERRVGKRFPTREELICGLGSEDGKCPICDDTSRWGGESMDYHCLCYVMDEIQALDEALSPYRTIAAPASLNDFKLWGNDEEKESLKIALAYVRNFVAAPRNWLYLYGGYGCGKTHMMRAAAAEFGPAALYITAGDFEAKLYRAMDSRGDLSAMLGEIERVPVLLYDDFGADYGSDFVKAKFRQIVDFRYGQKLPLMVTSNMTPTYAYHTYDGRTASRLFDKALGYKHNIKARDYRNTEFAASAGGGL